MQPIIHYAIYRTPTIDVKEAILGVLNMQWQSSTGKFIKIIKRIRVNF